MSAKIQPATPFSARVDTPTPHVDAAIVAIQNGDVFSADWATLRNYELAYPQLVQQMQETRMRLKQFAHNEDFDMGERAVARCIQASDRIYTLLKELGEEE